MYPQTPLNLPPEVCSEFSFNFMTLYFDEMLCLAYDDVILIRYSNGTLPFKNSIMISTAAEGSNGNLH